MRKERGRGTQKLTYTKTQTTVRSEKGGEKRHTETDLHQDTNDRKK